MNPENSHLQPEQLVESAGKPTDFWKEHIKDLEGVPPRELLVEAAEMVGSKKEALDLGPGALSDSIYLLSQGFEHVTAVDIHDTARELAKKLPQDKFDFVVSSFEDFAFGENTYDLINAQYSLPFNPPESFSNVIEKIKSSLKRGGVFTGNFLGMKDSWYEKRKGEMSFQTRTVLEELFADMETITFEEEERDGKTTDGKEKHWHLFNVIARKK